MAIDFKKMKAKLHALDNKGGSKNAAFWKPQDGDQNIRIVPTADGDPFKQFHFHYNVGKNPGFICPKKQHGKDCPVCNFAWHTYSEAKASNDQETLKFAKTLFPKERYFSPVVVRGEEDQGVVETPAERGVVGAGHPEVPLPERVGLVARLLQLLRDACARQQ